MDRPRFMRLALLAPLAATLVVAAAACSSSPEDPILQQFFTASRLRDNTTLQNFATVSFDPRTEGSAQSFKVVSVTPEQRKALNLKELAKAYDDAKAADTEFSKKKMSYQDENLEAIQRVLKAERANAKLTGKDAQVQQAWAKWREDAAEYAGKVSEPRSKLSEARGLPEISCFDPRNQNLDVTKYDGELLTKEVTVSAQVRGPDNQVKQRTLLITMQKAVLKGDKEIDGRWIVTGLRNAEK